MNIKKAIFVVLIAVFFYIYSYRNDDAITVQPEPCPPGMTPANTDKKAPVNKSSNSANGCTPEDAPGQVKGGPAVSQSSTMVKPDPGTVGEGGTGITGVLNKKKNQVDNVDSGTQDAVKNQSP